MGGGGGGGVGGGGGGKGQHKKTPSKTSPAKAILATCFLVC